MRSQIDCHTKARDRRRMNSACSTSSMSGLFVPIATSRVLDTRRNGAADVTIMGLTQLGVAVPNFWFAMLLVLGFAVTLRWFSAGGFPGWQDPLMGLKALTLPAIALALPQASILARVMRSAMLDTLGEDYIRTARAKGVFERLVISRHALRNALLPAITVIGLEFAFLIGGLVVTDALVMEAITAHHGAAEAAVLAFEAGADLILMDCEMPVMDGIEATKCIRQWELESGQERVPIVALTARAFEHDRKRCFSAGMDDFLTKPIRIGLLRSVLNRHVAVLP